MSTFAQIADEVSRKLAGFTLRQDRQTHLTDNITATDLIIAVASAQNISNGMIQVDDELIYVESFDRTNGSLIIPPYGRGYNGTIPASHNSGSKVVVSPTFPSIDVKNAINETIHSVFPSLYRTSMHSFSYNPAVNTYALPDNAENVVSVSYRLYGPSKEWLPVRSWRVDTAADTATFDSKNTITIYSPVQVGSEVKIQYTGAPDELYENDDVFSVTTGLPDSCKDVIIFGAAWRLSSFIDPGRLTFGSAEADQQSQIAGRAYGAGTSASKYLLAVYQQRLMEESSKMADRNPIRIHFTR